MSEKNTHYIVINHTLNINDSQGAQSFEVVNSQTYDDIGAASDVLIDYAVDNDISTTNLKIMEVKPINYYKWRGMLLARIVEWAEELRENIDGNKAYLQRPFLGFDEGTSVVEVVQWIKDKTGYDLSHYFRVIVE